MQVVSAWPSQGFNGIAPACVDGALGRHNLMLLCRFRIHCPRISVDLHVMHMLVVVVVIIVRATFDARRCLLLEAFPFVTGVLRNIPA